MSDEEEKSAKFNLRIEGSKKLLKSGKLLTGTKVPGKENELILWANEPDVKVETKPPSWLEHDAGVILDISEKTEEEIKAIVEEAKRQAYLRKREEKLWQAKLTLGYNSQQTEDTPDELRAQAESMTLQKLEEKIQQLRAELKVFEGYSSQVDATIEQLADDSAVGILSLEGIEKRKEKIRTEFSPGYEERKKQVAEAVPYMKENLKIFEDRLAVINAQKPTNEEVTDIQKQAKSLAEKSAKIVAKFNETASKLTEDPFDDELLGKAVFLHDSHEEMKTQFEDLRNRLAKWNIQLDSTFAEIAHIPNSLRRLLSMPRLGDKPQSFAEKIKNALSGGEKG